MVPGVQRDRGKADILRRRLSRMKASHTVTSSGVGFGSALAITISWSQWHSILWAILHGICSWLYVVYFWWTRR